MKKALLSFCVLLLYNGTLQAQSISQNSDKMSTITINDDNSLSFNGPDALCFPRFTVSYDNALDSSYVSFHDSSSTNFSLPTPSQARVKISGSNGSWVYYSARPTSIVEPYVPNYVCVRRLPPGPQLVCIRLLLFDPNWDTLCYSTFCDSVFINYSSLYCQNSFTYKEDSINNLIVNFKNGASVYGSAAYVTDYLWDFGDGSISTLVDPSHTYASSGDYDVCLIQTVRDSAGLNILCKDTICKTLTIKFDCKANFALDLNSSGSGVINVFNNSTFSNQQGSTIEYFWDFGDGFTSTQAYPTHTYVNPGYYYLCLSQKVISQNRMDTCYSYFCDSIGMDSLGNVLQKNGQIAFTLNVLNPGIGLEEISQNAITIFPNPANDVLVLELDNQVNEKIAFALTDLSGAIIYRGNIEENKSTTQINVSGVANGIYILSIGQGKERVNQKVLISH